MNKLYVNLYSETAFDKKEIFRYLGAKEPDDELRKLVDECIKEAEDISCFGVVFTVSDIVINENKIIFSSFSTESEALSKNLQSCDKVVIFAATTGIGIDRMISRYSVVSPVKAVIFQAIGAERIESLCDLFNEEIKSKYNNEGYLTKPRFSPGYGDLELSVQKDIFSLLDCEKKIGLTLADSMLMSPSKSVTAIIGLYRK